MSDTDSIPIHSPDDPLPFTGEAATPPSRTARANTSCFFKGKDAESVTHAFKQYTQKLVKQANRKPSINKTLAAAQALNARRGKVKNKDRGAR